MSHQGLAFKTLKKGWEFDLVFRTGFRVQGELVRLLLLRSASGFGGGLHVGYAVGKRQGAAHVRNRGRRVLREAFRRIAPLVESDAAMVLSLKNNALEAKATDVFYDMADVFKRSGLMRRSQSTVWDA